MPKLYTLLRKEITRIKGLQEEIIFLLRKDWFSEPTFIQALQPFLLVNARSQENYSQASSDAFMKKVLEIVQSKNKKSNLLTMIEIGCLLSGFSLFVGRRLVVTIDAGMSLGLVQDSESFQYITLRLGFALICFALAIEAFTRVESKVNRERKKSEDEEFRSKFPKIVALLQEFEKACEDLSVYYDLYTNLGLSTSEDLLKIIEKFPPGYITPEIYKAIQPKYKANFYKKENSLKSEEKSAAPSDTPPQTYKDQPDLLSENKSTYTGTKKSEKIAEKITAITRCFPPDTVKNSSRNNSCLMIKIPIQEVERKLSRLKEVTIERSHNGASLLIKFSDKIEIRVICEIDKKSRKNVKEQVSKKSMLSISKPKIGLSHLDEKKQDEKSIDSKKVVAITVEYRGSDIFLPPGSIISDKSIDVVIQAMQDKLKKLTDKSYNFLNPESKVYRLLNTFIKLTYIVKTLHPDLTILAFGGVWRSLLMREEPKDMDIAILISPEFDPGKELFEPLKQSKLIDDYRKSAKPKVTLYTVSFLNAIHEITFFKNQSIEANARTLDFTCNVFALEILRFDLPLIVFYTPLTSNQFLLAVKKGITPTIDVVINPSYINILKNAKMRTSILAMIQSVFFDWTPQLINSVMDALLKSPDNFSTIQPTRLGFFILRLLNFIDDPKRIIRLLNLYQSNHYRLPVDLQAILSLVPSILTAATAGLESKSTDFLLHKTHLLYYFREYMMKSSARQMIQPPLLSDLELLEAILLAGIALNAKQKKTVDKIFKEAAFIDRVRQICQCLSDKQKTSLAGCFSRSQQKTAIIDCFLVAITLTRTHQIFSTISTTHSDSTTFTQCYLRPAFHAELKKIATLLHHTVDYTSIDQEQLSHTLLYKWDQYFHKSNDSIEYASPEVATTTHTPDQTSMGLPGKPEPYPKDDVTTVLAPQARFFPPVTRCESSQSGIPKKPDEKKSVGLYAEAELPKLRERRDTLKQLLLQPLPLNIPGTTTANMVLK